MNALFKAVVTADTDGDGIATGSSMRIALFVTPVPVLLSGVMAPAPLGLALSRLEIGTLPSLS